MKTTSTIISMYHASTPLFIRTLKNLSNILDKAEVYATERNIDQATMTGLRLYPDMLPFSSQVQIACDTAKAAVARLAGVDVPKHEDTERTLAELKARIKKVLAFIAEFTPAQIDGSEGREITRMSGGGEIRSMGSEYLLGFALPNFYFHVVTAYDILRHSGVTIGKSDYIG